MSVLGNCWGWNCAGIKTRVVAETPWRISSWRFVGVRGCTCCSLQPVAVHFFTIVPLKGSPWSLRPIKKIASQLMTTWSGSSSPVIVGYIATRGAYGAGEVWALPHPWSFTLLLGRFSSAGLPQAGPKRSLLVDLFAKLWVPLVRDFRQEVYLCKVGFKRNKPQKAMVNKAYLRQLNVTNVYEQISRIWAFFSCVCGERWVGIRECSASLQQREALRSTGDTGAHALLPGGDLLPRLCSEKRSEEYWWPESIPVLRH